MDLAVSLLLAVVTGLLAVALAARIGDVDALAGWIFLAAAIGVLAAYHVRSRRVHGATPGQRWMGLAPASPAGAANRAPAPGAADARFIVTRGMAVVAAAGLLVLFGAAFGRFLEMRQKMLEGSTKGNLNSIRSAISIYYGDTEGLYPRTLSVDAASPFSRYIENIPRVTATHAGIGAGRKESPYGNMVLITTNETITITGRGWRYNPETGHVFVNSCATDAMGMPYSCYGY